MSALKERLEEVRQELTRLRAELRDRRAEFGRRIIERGALPNDDRSAEFSKEDSQLDKRAQAILKDRQRIASVRDRTGELAARREELARRRRELASDLGPLHERIGEAAFLVFRDNPLIDQEYADIFAPLLENHQEMKDLSRELAELESQLAEKAFLEKMMLRGKIVLLKNRRSSKEAAMTRLYREAGQRILETDFVTTIGDPQLSEAAEPYRQRVHEISEVDDDLERLEAEGEQLASEMESLVPSGKVRNRIDEMDEELDIIEAQRADLRMRVSVSVEERLEHPPADAEGNLQTQDLPAELSELLDSIRSKAGEIAQRDTLVQRLQAGIDAEQINGEIAQLDANISRKETQLERMKEEIESLQKHRQELESRMKAKQKERGSLKDLKPEAAK